MKRLSLALALILVLMIPVSVLAVTPLALPAYEIVSHDDGELQMIGFAGGDVQATVGFFGSSSTPVPTDNGTAPWQLVPTVPIEPSGLFTDGGEGMLGLAELADASEATGNPRAMFPIMLAFLLSLLFGFMVYGLTHNAKMGVKASLLLQSITSLVVLIFFYVGGGGVIPGWVLIPFGIEAFFIMLWRNPQHSST